MPLGFESGVWLWVAAAAFALGHLAVLAYFVRGNAGSSGPSMRAPHDLPANAEPGGPVDTSSDSAGASRGERGESEELPPVEREQVVQCPHCGVENAAEFRFCRFCVGELAGGTTVADANGASRDGQAF